MRPFLEAYANSGNVRASCAAAQVNRHTVWATEQADPAFREAKARAFQDFVDVLRGAAVQRSLKDSDRLLQFLLQAHEPETYALERRFRLLGGGPTPIAELPRSGAQAVPEGDDVREDRVIVRITNGQVLLEGHGTNGDR